MSDTAAIPRVTNNAYWSIETIPPTASPALATVIVQAIPPTTLYAEKGGRHAGSPRGRTDQGPNERNKARR